MEINLWKMIFVLTPGEKDICTNTCGSATEKGGTCNSGKEQQ
jgi:hypothetical protein